MKIIGKGLQGPPIDDSFIRDLVKLGRLSPLIHLGLMGIVFFLLNPLLPFKNLFIWLGCIGSISIMRVFFQIPAFIKRFAPRTYFSIFLVLTLLQAVSWSIGIIILPDTIPEIYHVFLFFLAGGMAAGAVASLNISIVLYLSYSVSIMAPIIVHQSLQGDQYSLAVATATAIFLLAMILAAVNSNSNYKRLYKTKAAVNKQSAFIRSIYSAARDISFITCGLKDHKYLIESFSPGAENIFGIRSGDIVGRPLSDMLSKESYAKWESRLSEVKDKTIAVKGEMNLPSYSGDEIHIVYSIYPLLEEDHKIYEILIICQDVTEQKKAEEKINVLAKFYAQNPDPVLRISYNGEVVSANEAGKFLVELWNSQDGDSLKAPDHIAAIVDFVLKTGARKDLEIDLGNQVFSMVFSPAVSDDYVNVYGHDVTERIRVQEELRESEKKFRHIIESSPMGMYIFTLESGDRMILTDVNPAADSILGFSHQPLIGKTMEEAFPGLTETDVPTHCRRAARTGISWQTDQMTYRDERIDSTFEIYVFQTEPGKIAVKFLDISDRKQAEQALRNSRQMLQSVLDTIPVRVFWKDLDLNYLGCNQLFAGDAGLNSPEEIIGKNDYQLAWRAQAELYRQNDFEVIQTEMPKLDYEEPQTGPDGLELWLRTSKILLRDPDGRKIGILGTYDDITSKKIADQLVRQSEEKYRTLVESMNDGLAIADLNENIIFVNKAACEIFGYSREELIGMNFSQIVLKEDLSIIYEGTNKRLGKQSSRYEIRICRSDGETRSIIVSAAPLTDNDGIVQGSFGIFADISDLKKAEKEKSELRDQLARAQRMESLGVLAGGVAHDLNNILGPLVAYPELINLKLPPDSPIKTDIARIEKSAKRAADVVQDLLTMARRGRYDLKALDLNELIVSYLQSADFIDLKSKSGQIDIETDLSDSLPRAYGSAPHLSKIIMNLVINAMEAMPSGGNLYISTIKRFINKLSGGFDQIETGEYIIMSVRDTGYGIEQADLKHLFEPFYTKKKLGRSGSGLGLAIVYGVIKDHNGYIDVRSRVNSGSEFTVYLPVVKLDSPKGENVIIDIRGSETIMVVDDIEEQRELARAILSSLGYRVETAACGREAVKRLKAKPADVVVLDMIMEDDFDGLDTYREIIKFNPGQKAIIASGFSETDRVREAEKLGVGKYVRKPYNMQILGRAIREVIQGAMPVNIL